MANPLTPQQKDIFMNRYTLAMLAAALSLSACAVTPETERTAVNMVEIQNGKIVRVAAQGPNTIVCQDYWSQFTLWDRALRWPNHITPEDADAVCRSKQQMATEAPTSRPWEPVFNHRRNSADPFVTDQANASRPGTQSGSVDIRAYNGNPIFARTADHH